MRIALAQINTTVGDVTGNSARMLDFYRRAGEMGADLVVFPELSLTGYPPRDLLLRASFIDENLRALERLATQFTGPGALVGFVGQNDARPGRHLTNSAALVELGKIIGIRHKTLLPTYDVFDEDRYFEPASQNLPLTFRGLRLGVTICEDLWNDEDFWPERRYRENPAGALAATGIDILVNLSASPWHLGKERTRHSMLSGLASKIGKPVIYCNLVGGNDELVFDGYSLAYDQAGRLIGQGKAFEEDLMLVNLEVPNQGCFQGCPEEESIYRALVLGLRDYLTKCGFGSAVLGLSGGIDSALVACLAAEALGPQNVFGVALPSQFSSSGSVEDARKLAANLGVRFEILPIVEPFESVKRQLSSVFAGLREDATEENIQARLRGVALMAMSNKLGCLLLTTGNKSELAVGYCTLYGDMCGGLAVISDVPKTMVYRVARWINRDREIIPNDSIAKPPSAELRPNQTDQDSLPPYDVLDAILELYVVKSQSMSEIVGIGFDEAVVRQVVRLIDLSEYKRRQAAPGLKVTTKAFGVGRRMPVAQKFREWK